MAAHPASIEDPQLAPRSTAPARMTAAPSSSLLTAASFRTWRGSETRAAQVPTFNAVRRGQAW